MERTLSATPLDAVLVEPHGIMASDVWLRRNIAEIEVETEGLPQTMWEADEVHGVVAGHPSVESVGADFEELWDRFEDDSKTDSERIAKLVEENAMLADALAELSEVASETVVTAQDNEDAIAELSEIVSNLVGGDK